jgi:hypothetical protein
VAATTRLTEWLATHTGKSLQAAEDYHSLPFLSVTRRLRDTRRLLTGQHRRRTLLRLRVFLIILAAILPYPKMDRIDGDCALTPMERAVIVTEIPGLISEVFKRGRRSREGRRPGWRNSTRHKLDTELQASAQEARRYRAEAERARALGGRRARRTVAFLQAGVAEENMNKITCRHRLGDTESHGSTE